MHWWVHDLYSNGEYVLLVSQIFWVIFSICLHELAHGWAALWQGDDTPRVSGHMTWNPLVHMGPWSLLMFALVGIAWGLMPTDPSRYRSRRRGRFYVAGAGPAMNLLLAFITLTAAALWMLYGSAREPLHGNITEFLLTGGWLNLALAIFNLLPVPPLDGANVLAGLSFRAYVFFQNPQVSMIGMLILMVLLFSGVGSVVFFGLPQIAALSYVRMIQNLLPDPSGA